MSTKSERPIMEKKPGVNLTPEPTLAVLELIADQYSTPDSNAKYKAFMMTLRLYPTYRSPQWQPHGVTHSLVEVTSLSFTKHYTLGAA